MAEYVDKGTAIAKLTALEVAKPNAAMTSAKRLLADMPDADGAPVVHGRWEFLGPNNLIKECMCGTCSACKVRSKYIVNTMLCPNCGAKMDGGNS